MMKPKNPMTDQPTPHRHTPHGHPCCDQAPSGPRPALVARCGGPGLCPACAITAGQIHSEPEAIDAWDRRERDEEIARLRAELADGLAARGVGVDATGTLDPLALARVALAAVDHLATQRDAARQAHNSLAEDIAALHRQQERLIDAIATKDTARKRLADENAELLAAAWPVSSPQWAVIRAATAWRVARNQGSGGDYARLCRDLAIAVDALPDAQAAADEHDSSEAALDKSQPWL